MSFILAVYFEGVLLAGQKVSVVFVDEVDDYFDHRVLFF